MFHRIRQLFQNARIAFDYPRFESKAREEHAVRANTLFSTTRLRRQLSVREARYRAEAEALYGAPLAGMQSEISTLESTIADARIKLLLFKRDYALELHGVHQRLEQIRDRRREISVALSSAHGDLKLAKENLDDWYSKAEGTFFGNGGKELPRHSPFGQSLADRDQFKSERDAAARRVHQLHGERAELDQRAGSLRSELVSIKACRDSMYRLKTEGFDTRLLDGVVATGEAHLGDRLAALKETVSARKAFLAAARVSSGAETLEAQIDTIEMKKREFVGEFDSEKSRLHRKSRHREEWLSEHTS